VSGTTATTPTAATSLVNKQYVDAQINGLNAQPPCDYGTTAALTATYANGSSGVGATLTASANGVFTVDGATPAVTKRILIKDQANAAQNGAYTVTNAGSVSTAWVLTRATDYDLSAEMNAGANDGKMNPALVPGYEAAKKKIADQEAIWTKQKEQAARDTDLAYGRVRINPQAAKDYTKPSAAPAALAPATSGPISGEFSAPTQAHIAALKANPTQAAAFDAKFGPGAANEYLGK